MNIKRLLALIRTENRINEKDDLAIDEFLKRRDEEKKNNCV